MIDVFIIDPPWPKKKGGLRSVRPKQGRSLDYNTMPFDAIFDLLVNNIFPLANEKHAVFMWVIEQFLTDCDIKMESLGYKRHVRMVWDKTNGAAPAFTVRFSHEYLIWYYKPKMIPINDSFRGKYTSVIREKSREHSRKPDAAYNMITNLYPDVQKIDVFSREFRPGFLQWGNQINHFDYQQKLF